jgi:hypothetical protein
MTRAKSIITNTVLALTMCLLIMATAFLINDAQAVQADASEQINASNQVVYLQLNDAPPVRDIAIQRIAPLQ